MYCNNSIEIKLKVSRTYFPNMNIAEYTTSITIFQTDPKFHVTCKKKLYKYSYCMKKYVILCKINLCFKIF